jgi:hypothetical protein
MDSTLSLVGLGGRVTEPLTLMACNYGAAVVLFFRGRASKLPLLSFALPRTGEWLANRDA